MNAPTVVQQNMLPMKDNVLWDQLSNGFYAHRNCPHTLRRVVVWDAENIHEIAQLSNHLKLSVNTTSAVYRVRWKIELFKALKPNQKSKTFLGTSENAIYIQIWTALIAMLLVKRLQFKSKFGWSISNLFTH